MSMEQICIIRLRMLAKATKLTPQEQRDLIRAIQALQYTRVTDSHHQSVDALFEHDQPADVVAISNGCAKCGIGTFGRLCARCKGERF
jgi:hypothetical protein